MHVLRSKKKWIAATVGVAVIATVAAAVALGSPKSDGLAISTLVTANFDDTVQVNSDRVKFQTKDATDVRIQKLVFGAGDYTGWHHHPGLSMVAVESGAITLWKADCSSTTYGPNEPAGAVFAQGSDEVEQATSTNGATVYAIFVAPNDAGFRLEDDEILCP